MAMHTAHSAAEHTTASKLPALPAIGKGGAVSERFATSARTGGADADLMDTSTDEDDNNQTLQVGHRPVDRVLATFQQEERFDAFTSLTLNYVALHQKISAMGSLRESVQRLAQALEGIPSWRVDGSWTSAHLRETMLRSGIDQVVQTTGGQGFIYLFGRALELRSAEESNDIFHFYSASAQSAFMYMQKKYMERNDISDVTMVHERDVAPRFGDQHTPLFKTICNTGMPAVHSWKRLKALTLQRRANVPRHHFKLATTALLPFGTGTDGVLLGLSNGAYPELIVSELSRVARRFLDGVASTWRRLHEDEIRRNEEEVLRLRRKLEAEFTTALAAAARDSGDMELQLEQMCVVLEKRFGPACYVPMALQQNKGGSKKGSQASSHREDSQQGSMRKSAVTSQGGSRAPVRFDKFSILPPIFAPDGMLRAELASIMESPNFGEMAGQIMTKAQPWTCVGQEEVSVFQGALLDSHRTVLFLPLWDEDETPLGMVVMFPLGDLATTPLTQQVAQRCLTDHINNINHSAAMLDAVFAQAIPTIILDDVREGQRSQLRRVRNERDPIRKLALESLPMWSKRSSTTEPQFLLRSEMADSMVVGQSLKPEARQALYTSFWSQFTGAAAKIGESKILFVKTIGDAIVFLGGVKPIKAERMFDLGNTIHTVTAKIMDDLTSGALLLPAKLTGKAAKAAKVAKQEHQQQQAEEEEGGDAYEEEESEDEQMIFLNHDDIVKGGPALRVEFRSAVMGARTPEDLMSFVTPVGGQLRLDFAGMTAEYVQRVEAAAPAGQGVLTDVHTAAMLDHGSFRVSKPKTVQLRGFSASAELVLVTPELSNGRSANAAATAAALTVSPDHGPEPVPAAAGEGDRF
eukprot:TRINITY_DN1044_c0_g1_i18.p1 TRINITY_DN1044_c0_g1~~TRINITY_DN1044_c0_g1_i18.p1  ORF type:complete len:864 (+),score=284.39 TRINITY_DN1044_c0_g1_i18:76-2667(+)